MGVLRLNDESISKYFELLKHLDNKSKQKLITKLSNSMKSHSNSGVDIDKLYGAWEDDRSTQELIDELRKSRTNNKEIENFS